MNVFSNVSQSSVYYDLIRTIIQLTMDYRSHAAFWACYCWSFSEKHRRSQPTVNSFHLIDAQRQLLYLDVPIVAFQYVFDWMPISDRCQVDAWCRQPTGPISICTTLLELYWIPGTEGVTTAAGWFEQRCWLQVSYSEAPRFPSDTKLAMTTLFVCHRRPLREKSLLTSVYCCYYWCRWGRFGWRLSAVTERVPSVQQTPFSSIRGTILHAAMYTQDSKYARSWLCTMCMVPDAAH